MIKMTTKLKAAAILLMAAAMACVVGSFSASNKRLHIQGPSALAVLPDRSVWVSVEDTLWHLDENGMRTAVVDAAALRVGGLIGNLEVHPNGQLVASVRDDPTLYFLDSKTGIIKSRLIPQWPADLARHGSRAITYAFDDNGRVAIATGGGHTVAVFDANGRFLARTKPGTYEFTNGLWWSGNSLWTTDTNRPAAVQLDGETLIEKSRVKLTQHCGGWQYLGMATASHGKELEVTHIPPLGTIVRFANGMTQGHATDIFSDGTQWDFPVTGTPEPRDIKWLGNELLMVDGASYAIRRYSDDHVALPDFGDAQVQDELKASLDRRKELQTQYQRYIAGAVLLFLAGFAFAWGTQSLEKEQTLNALNIDLSQLGTPLRSPFALFVSSLKIYWPAFIAVCAIFISQFMLRGLLKHIQTTSAFLGLLLFMTVAVILVFVFTRILLRQNIERAAADPAAEALFNQRAVQFLKSTDVFWKVRRPDELPLETLILAGRMGGMNLLVLTGQRLLVFVANLRDRTLAKEYLRQDIRNIRLLDPREMTWLQRVTRFFMLGSGVARIEFRDGTALTGHTMSTQTVLRMSARLREIGGIASAAPPPSQITSPAAKPDGNAARQVLASMLIPGLGQWMQGRSGTALIFFVIWLFILSTAVLVAWTLWRPMAAVSPHIIVSAASYYLVVCAVAAVDAWRMRSRVNLPGSK